MTEGLIDSGEMYLRTVLELEEEDVPALRARISERLGLSAPTVSEGVARLEDDGLVKLAPDRTVQLTPAGRDAAERVMRKHRLAERLLVDVIGLETEYVHEEACRWEHVISDRVEGKLADLLGNPTTSPYGCPIPGTEERDYEPLRLTEVDDGPVRIERISELLQKDLEIMAALEAHDIRAGETVTVTQDPEAVRLATDYAEIEIDRENARLVYVSQPVTTDA